jgi:hypothetical protein
MSYWRFYPLQSTVRAGLLVKDGAEVVAARFLTPGEAKALAPRKISDQRGAS